MGNAQSNEQFQSRVNMIFTGTAPKGAEFWTTIWLSKVPAEEMTKLITPEMIRAAKSARPNNLVLLLEEIARELRERKHGFDAIMTCVDLLTRIIPFLLEPDTNTDTDTFAAKHLFPTATSQQPSLGTRLLSALLDLLFLPDFSVAPQLATIAEGEEVPLATHCWAPGVGVSTVGGTAAGRWCPCAGNPAYLRRIGVLRCLIACCSGPVFAELGACSEPATAAPAMGFLEELTRAAPRRPLPQAKALLCSLVNTVCAYDPVGWGLPYNHLVSSNVPERLVDYSLRLLMILLTHNHSACCVTKALPADTPAPNFYLAGLPLAGEARPRQQQQQQQQQQKKKTKKDDEEKDDDEDDDCDDKKAEKSGTEVGCQPWVWLGTEEEQGFVYRGLVRLLENTYASASAYLPFAHTDSEFFREVLVALFVLLLASPAFRGYCLAQETFNRGVLVSALYYIDACCSLAILGARGEETAAARRAHALRRTSGVSHLCALILLLLSENRLFGVGLNRPVAVPPPIQLPALPTRSGAASYADVLVLTFYKVFSDENYYFLTKNPTLVECLLSVLANASPYIKALSMPAAFKLLEAFTKLAEPRSLARPGGPSMLAMLLETVTNLVQYEYQGNLPVVYAVLRFKDELAQLHAMSYKTFQADLAKRKRNVAAASEKTDPNAERIFNAWKEKLPVGILVDAVKALSPQIQRVCSGNADDQQKILRFLAETSLVGLIPPPGPVAARRYAHSKSTASWLVQLAWFITYARFELNSFAGLNIKLFKVIRKSSQATAAAAAAAATTTATSASASAPDSTPAGSAAAVAATAEEKPTSPSETKKGEDEKVEEKEEGEKKEEEKEEEEKDEATAKPKFYEGKDD